MYMHSVTCRTLQFIAYLKLHADTLHSQPRFTQRPPRHTCVAVVSTNELSDVRQ